MKTGKEEVRAVLAAVEYWAHGRARHVEQDRWDKDLQSIDQIVEQFATVQAKIMRSDSLRSPVPRLAIRWDSDIIEITGLG